MNRRTTLRSLGVGLAAVLTGCAEQAANTVESFGGTPTPFEWPATEELDGPFKQATYYKSGKVEIGLDQFHEVDGWILLYHEYTEYDNAIRMAAAPTGSNPTITLPLARLVRKQNRDYPDSRFKLIAANGVFSGVVLVREQVHTAWLHLPSQWFSNESESEADRTLTPQENTTVGFGE